MYHLFAWDEYENEYGGGMDSYIKSFDTLDQLKAYFFPEGNEYPIKSYGQIVKEFDGDYLEPAKLVLLETYHYYGRNCTMPDHNKWIKILD